MSKPSTAQEIQIDAAELTEMKRRARDLIEHGEDGEAEKILQKALALDPEAPDLLFLLGRCAHARMDLNAAARLYDRALKQAEMVEAYNALADIFITTKQGAEALKVVERAEKAGVANYDTLTRKGFAYLVQQDIRNSLFYFMKAVGRQPYYKDARVFISHAIRPGMVPNYNEEFKAALVACLQSDDMEHYTLAQAWLHQIQKDPNAKALLELFKAEDYESFAFLYSDPKNRSYLLLPFFRLGMEKLVIMTLYYERFLKNLRRFYLETIHAGGEILTEEHSLICSLAVWCFLAEFVLSVTDEERSLLDDLRTRLESGAAAWPEEVAIFAAYDSLNTLRSADSLAADQRLRRDEVGRLIRLQIDEPRAEKEIRKQIQSLVPVEDNISRAVQAMYEENPYPRWLSCSRIAPIQDRHSNKKNLKILVAGCGTGRQPIQIASIFPRADVLAVDLSSSSIAYAIRKAQEYNIDNITFRQGDILNLAKALEPNSFDRVDCTGVLHHMKDPMAGWRVITDLLKPGGLMTVGLYSELSRKGIVKAREMIAKKGFAPTVDGIRECRDYIWTLPEGDPVRKLALWRDFYSISDCRDMIFHVQEHRFTLLQIRDCLDELGLELRSLAALKPEQIEAYRKIKGNDAPLTDLETWHRLEEEDNDFFFSIYQFQAVKKT